MNKLFSTVPVRGRKRSVFDLSHQRLTTMQMGKLVPILCKEVMPGDTFRLNTECFVRFAPMLSPIMQEVNVFVHHFFVPLRLCFKEYERFFNPEQTANFPIPLLFPYTEANLGDLFARIPDEQWDKYLGPNSLWDYLGLPTTPYYSDSEFPNYIDRLFRLKQPISALPFYAYQRIYYDYYRDQNFTDAIDPLMDKYPDGISVDDPVVPAITSMLLKLQTRAYEKDYFTSALPSPQAGADVYIPLTGDAQVVLRNPDLRTPLVYPTSPVLGTPALDLRTDSSGKLIGATANDGTANVQIDPNGTLFADLSQVTSATINELRRAISAQKFLEATARAGKRYKEIVEGHFPGVRVPDGRINRPEYLGGGRYPVQISEVLSHVGSSEDGAQTFVLGDYAGHGLSAGQTGRYKAHFTEHGYLMSIMSVMPRTSYMQGIDRMWSRQDLYDFPWPEFGNLGEQEIKNREIFAFYQDNDELNETFGYAPRYAEYKYSPNVITGDFKFSLDYWHLGRKFSFNNPPVLNQDFVKPSEAELNRIFAVQQEGNANLLCQLYHHLTVARLLPKYGIPSL